MRALPAPFSVGVAGDTAGYVDLEHSLATHIPIVLGLIIASTMLVLFLMTGSFVLGVKAVLMNALTLSAVFGILVLIFQQGRLQGLLAYHSTGALDATQPILLFAIGFGLATDYSVMLLSRIKEAYDSGIPNIAPWRSASSAPGGSSRPRRFCSPSLSAPSRPRS